MRQDLCRTRAGFGRPGLAEEVRVGKGSLRLLLPCRLHAGCVVLARRCDPMAQSRCSHELHGGRDVARCHMPREGEGGG